MIIRIKLSRILLLSALALFSIPAAVLAANYASTTIWVNVADDTSFTMTILGCTATTVSSTTEASATNTTGDISFNATGADPSNAKLVDAQAITGDGAACGGGITQVGNIKPIITLVPAGNVFLNFSIRISGGAPTDLNFTFKSFLYNTTASNTGGCLGSGPANNTVLINSSSSNSAYQMIARGINNSQCQVNITAFANFTASPNGQRRIGELVTNSTNLQL